MDTVIKVCVEFLISCSVDEIKFLRSVGGEVGGVQQELKRLQLLLEEVDRSKYKEKSVLYFFKRMREFSHRIENVVDKYEAEVVIGKQKGVINRVKRIACSICECISLCEVGEEIVTIKKDIPKLEKEIKESKNQKSEISVEDGGEKRTFGDKVEKDFVGKEKDMDLLVAELLNGANTVVSICGMGGLGKTTLAKKIYHHKDIRLGFQAFGWACVTQVCKPKKVLRDLLGGLNKKITDAERKNMSRTKLVEEVREVLRVRKCLIVVDAIWEVGHWRYLEDALPLEAANSKVLFTTRKASVAGLGFFHPLGFLSEDDAWKLLQKKAFDSGDRTDLSVEQLGREMVKKCGYLPSAIEVLGGVLKSNNDWATVNTDIDLFSKDGSSADRKIKGVLSLSYYDLPHHLKPCFLYMSQFQGNIRPERLFLMWIAEGLVSPNDQEKNKTLIDVAERFLGELTSRSMVQVRIDETIALKESKSCWLHNLWRDWCLAKSEEEEFLKLMDFRDGKRPPSFNNPHQRLAVYLDIKFDVVSLIEKSSQSLRSLFIHGPRLQNPITLPQGVIDFDDLKYLRVLNFENVDFKGNKLLEKISKLIHLRLLGFKSCILSELPSCIVDLPFLHTLVLEALVEISFIICKIKQLRYLDVRGGSFPGKLALSNLDKLERFYGFDSRTWEIMDLSKLPNLRHLQALIDGNENLSKFISCIEAYGKHLDYIDLEIFNCEFISEQGMAVLSQVCMTCNIGCIILYNSPIGKLPKYEAGFFPSLTVLNLVRCEILEDPMDTLERLPKLTELGLENSYKGKEMICHTKGFAQLRRLRLHSLFNLKKWRVEKGAMQCLSILELVSCDKLGMLPDGIRFITTLRELVIGDMPSEFKGRVEKGGEDFVKICHVNLVTISDY